ncbi:Uncharacterized membrane protein YgdD, TMEM256/DUF423 family [Nitrosomonas marina]|uniref:Uncharacterized membrane protein YgdD, TMEM256/DUF423 family n=1 Tax=Nitrosomonas marina TaxID=917 RepID=A0A1I0FS74_9PROT|nr:DUF423 domain-containing protein [Nitrosomonas marina]SET61057.1 Uncharacterized membrane protein YgdD, TMEM256/DUF423 family [Nitrosomonas marina]
MPKPFLLLGAINTFLCIALGAFGAHGLKSVLTDDMQTIFHTGLQYHLYHSFGLLIIGLLLIHYAKSRLIELSGWLMLLGIILFSFNLYMLSLTEIRAFGIITPFGGFSYIVSWVVLAIALWKVNPSVD